MVPDYFQVLTGGLRLEWGDGTPTGHIGTQSQDKPDQHFANHCILTPKDKRRLPLTILTLSLSAPLSGAGPTSSLRYGDQCRFFFTRMIPTIMGNVLCCLITTN